MKSMSYIVLILIFVSCNKKIDTLILESKSSVEIESRVPQFPDDWLGYWSGDIDIYNEKGKTMTVPMALDHAVTPKDSVWTWAIIYGEDTIAGRRDYELNIVDSTKGHYLVDEKNSIFLDAFVLGNNLVSTFKVGENYLLSSYELDGNEMIFTVNFFSNKVIRKTGDTIQDEEDIPIVYSYKNTVYQKARLKKGR